MLRTLTVLLLIVSVFSQSSSGATRVYPRIDLTSFNLRSGNYGRMRDMYFSQYGGLGQTSTTTSTLVTNALTSAKAEASASTQYQSSSSMFTKLPTLKQVEQLILAVNRIALMQVIQRVVSHATMKCDQKLTYLMEIFGMIQVALENKRFANSSSTIRQIAVNQSIARDQAELERNQALQAGLNLTDNRAQLRSKTTDLQNAYIRYNENRQVIFPAQNTISDISTEIDKLVAENIQLRENRETDRLRLAEIDYKIESLRNNITDKQSHRTMVEFQLNSSQRLIINNNNRIQDYRIELANVENEIESLNARADQIQKLINELSVEVRNMQRQSSLVIIKRQNYQTDIDSLNTRIQREQAKINPEDITNLLNMVGSLQTLQDIIDQDINDQAYSCFQEPYEMESVDGIVVYVVRGSRFREYLMNGYGSSIFNSGLTVRSGIDYNFRKVDIFGGDWSVTYGYPFPDSLGGDNNNFDGSFNCLQLSAATQGVGTITSINENRIQASTLSGQDVQLNLAPCSAIDSTTTLPQVGQVIAFSGVRQGSEYNVYKSACWSQ